MAAIHTENRKLLHKYKITSWFYDILDYPWERQYRLWRPEILKDVTGLALEAGVGTGRNLKYYPEDVELTAIDMSPCMLKTAIKRGKDARCKLNIIQNDAIQLRGIPSNHFSWYISTFMFCVMPNCLQPLAIDQMVRVLKPGGRFRIIEMVYSKKIMQRLIQKLFSPFVEKVFGARFDRETLKLLNAHKLVEIKETRFLKKDTYLLIEGIKKN